MINIIVLTDLMCQCWLIQGKYICSISIFHNLTGHDDFASCAELRIDLLDFLNSNFKLHILVECSVCLLQDVTIFLAS